MRVAATTSVIFYLCLSLYLVVFLEKLHDHDGGFNTLDVRYFICAKLKKALFWKCFRIYKRKPVWFFFVLLLLAGTKSRSRCLKDQLLPL